MPRTRLPARRRAETFEFVHVTPNNANIPLRATIGFYDDGRIGEVFLSSSKIGTDLDIAIKDGAILLSFALQFGATVEEIRASMTRSAAGKPEGAMGTLLDLLVDRYPPKAPDPALAPTPRPPSSVTGGVGARALPGILMNDTVVPEGELIPTADIVAAARQWHTGSFQDGNEKWVSAGMEVLYKFGERRGTLIDALQDGDADVKFHDTGLIEQVKWKNLCALDPATMGTE